MACAWWADATEAAPGIDVSGPLAEAPNAEAVRDALANLTATGGPPGLASQRRGAGGKARPSVEGSGESGRWRGCPVGLIAACSPSVVIEWVI